MSIPESGWVLARQAGERVRLEEQGKEIIR